MKKITIFILSFVGSLACAPLSADQSSGSQLMPPPVSVINWHKGMSALDVQGFYMTMTPKLNLPGSMKFSGAGLLFDYNKSASEHFGFNLNGSVIGMTGTSEDTYSQNNLYSTMLNINPNLVYTPIDGEKKDIAGEIVDTGFSWAIFGGVGLMAMNLDTQQVITVANITRTPDTMMMTMTSFDYGTVMEIPLSWWISLEPSYTITQFVSGSVTVGGQTIEIDASNLPAQSVYGADILIRPLKLNPNLRISLGALAGMIAANSDNSDYSSTMIMLGIQYEWGKHYSSSFISPGFTR